MSERAGQSDIGEGEAEAIARDIAIVEAIGSGGHVFDEIETAQATKGRVLADALIALNHRGLIRPQHAGWRAGWVLTALGRARMEALR